MYIIDIQRQCELNIERWNSYFPWVNFKSRSWSEFIEFNAYKCLNKKRAIYERN